MSRYYPRDEIATIRRELEKLGSLRGFPVGALFLSAVPTNPAVLLGYGEWEAFGKGRMLAGHDPDDTDFDTAGQTGGAKTKAISAHAGTAVVDHTNHTHAVTSNVTAGFTTIGSSPGTPVNTAAPVCEW